MQIPDSRTASPLRSGTGLLLGVAIVVVIVIVVVTYGTFHFAVQLYGPPEGPGEFGNAFGLASAAFSGLALLGVALAVYIQNRDFSAQIRQLQDQTRILHAQNVLQVLSTVLLEYRSIEMFSAIKHLWNFHRVHSGDLTAAYRKLKREEEQQVASLPERERLAAEALTLHYRRQFVSRFYQFLAGLLHEGSVPPELVYRYWDRGQLQIIPTILLPIEEDLDKEYNLGQDNKRWIMRQLYDQSPALGESKT